MAAVILVGGGLANSLIALRLRALRPELSLLMLEQGPAVGGNHTWSFHESDLTPGQQEWLGPLVAHAWPTHEVRFPHYARQLAAGYRSVTSTRLDQTVCTALEGSVRTGVTVTELRPDGVRLQSGEFHSASLVIDGRGFPASAPFDLRYQKFLGQEVTLEAPHGLTAPMLMDATVAQRDGYRFLYVLPFTGQRLLIEDTCYSDNARLDAAGLRRAIHDYARSRGWRIAAVEREETGVLPIVLGGRIHEFWAETAPDMPRSGLRAMLFHHTTGYSLPEAVRLADTIGAMRELSSPVAAAAIRGRAMCHWREQRIFRLLNRMLFNAACPEERYRVLQFFYRLPEPTIARFYAGRFGVLDMARLCLGGAPPVPITRALRALLVPGAAGPASGVPRGGNA